MNQENKNESVKNEKRFSTERPVQLGLCCLNTELRGRTIPIFASRKMIIRTIKEKGIGRFKIKNYTKPKRCISYDYVE